MTSPTLDVPTGRPARAPLAPALAVRVLAALGALLLLLPLLGLLAGGGLTALPDALANPGIRTALRLTAVTSAAATVVALVVGVPLAVVAERSGGRIGALAGVVGEIPLVIPPVVTGLGLLLAFGRDGLLSAALDVASLRVTFTATAVVLAQATAAIPMVVLATRAGLAALDPAPELAAATLGDPPLRRTLTVTLPALRGPIVLGAALAWGRAAGEFGATLTFAGSLPGRTRTLPLEVFAQLQTDTRLAAAAAVAQVALAVAVVAIARLLRPRP